MTTTTINLIPKFNEFLFMTAVFMFVFPVLLLLIRFIWVNLLKKGWCEIGTGLSFAIAVGATASLAVLSFILLSPQQVTVTKVTSKQEVKLINTTGKFSVSGDNSFLEKKGNDIVPVNIKFDKVVESGTEWKTVTETTKYTHIQSHLKAPLSWVAEYDEKSLRWQEPAPENILYVPKDTLK